MHEVLAKGRFLSLVRRDGWEYCERHNATAVIGVVAVTADDKILLVEQFRPPVNASVIELPAGLVGDEDASEELLVAAQRELLEETGYESEDWTRLSRGPTTAGMSSELLTLFLARQCVRTVPGGGVGDEAISVHAVALSECSRWLQTQADNNRLIDPKVFAGVHFAS